MTNEEKLSLASAILNKAVEFGATLVGIAAIEDLKTAPGFTMAPKLGAADVGSRPSETGLKPGEVAWPAAAKTAVIIAIAHPEDDPAMDWWYGKIDPPGNRKLASTINELSEWVKETYKINTYPLAYHVEKGGIFLKDSAVMAGLGCIGKDNLLVTPEYGPRVRLRAMLLEEELPSTGPMKFDPCVDCSAPCLKPCPVHAFDEQIYTPEKYGQEKLPGRIGNYSRDKCNVRMTYDIDVAKEELHTDVTPDPVKVIKYCRSCELSCPVGKKK